MPLSRSDLNAALEEVVQARALAQHRCCVCAAPATWHYLPSDGGPDERRWRCDDHVPRGCSCMTTPEWDAIDQAAQDAGESPAVPFDPDQHYQRDAQGRLEPCIEWGPLDPEDVHLDIVQVG